MLPRFSKLNAALLTLPFVFCGCIKKHPEFVEIKELYSHPREFDGRFLTVRGFLMLERENCSLGVSEKMDYRDIELRLRRYGCSSEIFSELNFRDYSVVTGVFHYLPDHMAQYQIFDAEFDSVLEKKISTIKSQIDRP